MIKEDIILLVYEQANTKSVFPLLEKERTLLPGTYMHSIRTAIFSTALAQEKSCRYSSDELKDIATGALLHDIGKLAIPYDILSKPDTLTPLERYRIKEHPSLGLSLLPDGFSKIVKDIILMHHEKTDGSGYPNGIRQIPEYVQFVTVADMYEAMTSKRHYKAAYSSKKAYTILKHDMELGKLSPELVEFFSF